MLCEPVECKNYTGLWFYTDTWIGLIPLQKYNGKMISNANLKNGPKLEKIEFTITGLDCMVLDCRIVWPKPVNPLSCPMLRGAFYSQSVDPLSCPMSRGSFYSQSAIINTMIFQIRDVLFQIINQLSEKWIVMWTSSFKCQSHRHTHTWVFFNDMD